MTSISKLEDIKSQMILGGSIKVVLTNDKETRTQVFAVGIFKPGEGLYPHSHPNSEEIYFVLKGRGTVFLGKDRKPVELEPEMTLHVPANTIHAVTNTGKDLLEIAFFLSPGKSPAGYSIASDITVAEERILVKPNSK